MNRPFAAGGLLALCLALASLAQAQGVLTPQQIAQRSRLATVQIRSLDASGEVKSFPDRHQMGPSGQHVQ